MKILVSKLLDFLLDRLPLFQRRGAAELKDFTCLVEEQFDFLVEKVEQFQKEYIVVMEQVQRLLKEIADLNHALQVANNIRCSDLTCDRRIL